MDFFSIHRQQGPNITFIDMMAKLECRFGAKELPETSKAKFQQATQNQNESLEDWADRVLSLAMPAFRDLPEQYCTEEVISRFCQGCLDKEAGKHACLIRPKSMQGAIDLVRHHQYISTAVDGKVSRQKNNSVNAVSRSEDKISRLEKKLDLLMEKLVKAEPSNSSKPKEGFRGFCYFCNKRGHMQRECIHFKEEQARVGKEGKLNVPKERGPQNFNWKRQEASNQPTRQQTLNYKGQEVSSQPPCQK